MPKTLKKLSYPLYLLFVSGAVLAGAYLKDRFMDSMARTYTGQNWIVIDLIFAVLGALLLLTVYVGKSSTIGNKILALTDAAFLAFNLVFFLCSFETVLAQNELQLLLCGFLLCDAVVNLFRRK